MNAVRGQYFHSIKVENNFKSTISFDFSYNAMKDN